MRDHKNFRLIFYFPIENSYFCHSLFIQNYNIDELLDNYFFNHQVKIIKYIHIYNILYLTQ